MLLYCFRVTLIGLLMRSTNSRYTRSVLGLAIISAGLALGVSALDRWWALPTTLRPIVVLIPVVPLVLFLFRIARWLRDLDELERMIHHEAILVQFGATGILVMSYGMVAKAGLVPDFRASQVFPFLWFAIFVFWCLGLVLVRRKYR